MAMIPPNCFPNADFSFPRSYVTRFAMQPDGKPVTQIDNLWRIDYGGSPFIRVYAEMKAEVYEWSSNRYYMKGIWSDLWYTSGSSPTKLPYLANFTFANDPDGGGWVLALDPTRAGSAGVLFSLPQAPTDYWLKFV